MQFPFRVQYSILASTQKLLEECCYDFTRKYAPDLLADKRWDCAEAIELNKWTLTVIKRLGKFPAGAFAKPDSQISQVLLAVNKLRHSAAHRLRISAKGIIQMADAAVKFAEILSDSVRASQLEELYKELKSNIKSQELNKNYLETKLKDELDDIKRQREELAKREREAVSTMVAEDEDNMHFIGSLLGGRLQKILSGDSADDEIDGSDQLEDAKVEATDENPSQADSPKEPESPKLVPNGIKSGDETMVEEAPTNIPNEDHEDDRAEQPPPEEPPFTEPTVDEAEVSLARIEVQPGRESDFGESATESRPEIEQVAVEPPKPEAQYDSIVDAIQDILKSQDIDTSDIRQITDKRKKEHHRLTLSEMTKIKWSVSEILRRKLENVCDSPVYCRRPSENMLTVSRMHSRTLYWHR